MFKFADETLQKLTLSVKVFVILSGHLTIRLRRNYRNHSVIQDKVQDLERHREHDENIGPLFSRRAQSLPILNTILTNKMHALVKLCTKALCCRLSGVIDLRLVLNVVQTGPYRPIFDAIHPMIFHRSYGF